MKNDIKIIIFCLSVIFIIFFSSYYINNYVIKTTEFMISEIKLVETYADQNQWEKAYDKINELSESWDNIENKWTLLINHHEIDNITISLRSVYKYVEARNKTETKAYIAVLKHYIMHIPEMEKLTWKNIL